MEMNQETTTTTILRNALLWNSNASVLNHITATALVHWFTMLDVKTVAILQPENVTLIPATATTTPILGIHQILLMTPIRAILRTLTLIPTQHAPKRERSGATVIPNRNVHPAIGKLWKNALTDAIP